MIPRLTLAAGFAVAIAGSTLLAPAARASCTAGEEEDVYTTVCTPFMAPNTTSPFTAIPGNPDIPAIDGVPCTGRDSGQCIGLAEDAEAAGPEVVPRTTISASP